MKNCNILFKKANLTFILMFVGLMFSSAQEEREIGHFEICTFQENENPQCLLEGDFEILIHGEISSIVSGINHELEVTLVAGHDMEKEVIASWTKDLFNYSQTSSWKIEFDTESIFDCDLNIIPINSFFVELSIGGNFHESIEIKLCCIERWLTDRSNQLNFRAESETSKYFVLNSLGQKIYESNSSLDNLLGGELNVLSSGLYYIVEKSQGSRKLVKQIFLP